MILDQLSLDGKRALVTGGSRGLGFAMAMALAEAGADVAIVARDVGRLAESTQMISDATGRTVLPIAANLADVDAAKGVVDQTVADLGGLNILVTAAAAQLRKPALEVTPDDFDMMFAVGLRSIYFMCQQAAKAMLQNSESPNRIKGKIVNIASLTSFGAWPDVSLYGTIKGGVQQMTKAMALEWAPLGICVNAIGPGTFHTELTDALYSDPERAARITSRIPLGRPGMGPDLGGAVVYLASNASDYVTGQVLWVDGGFLLVGTGI